MKTSTKILIFLLLCIPVALWAYNVLLRQQLTAKNFLVVMRADPNRQLIKQKLPPFKHLMVDGVLYTGDDGKHVSNNVGWIARVNVQNTRSNPLVIKFPRKYEDVLRYQVKNDTLYLSFCKKINPGALENQYMFDEVITINGFGYLQSVDGINTKFSSVGSFDPVSSFSTKISGTSKYEISNIQFKKLKITADNASSFNLNTGVDTLQYSLLGHSKLDLRPLNIKTFYPGKIDSLAEIGINGNANKLKLIL